MLSAAIEGEGPIPWGWGDHRPAAGRVAADPRRERYVRLQAQRGTAAEDLPGLNEAERRVGRGAPPPKSSQTTEPCPADCRRPPG